MILTTNVRQAVGWVEELKVGLLMEALVLSLEPSGSMGGGTVLFGSENYCLEGLRSSKFDAGLFWRRAWRWQRMQEETGMEHFTFLEGKLSNLPCSKRPWTSLNQ